MHIMHKPKEFKLIYLSLLPKIHITDKSLQYQLWHNLSRYTNILRINNVRLYKATIDNCINLDITILYNNTIYTLEWFGLSIK